MKKVLVISPKRDARKLIGDALEREGYEVIVANTGQEAIAATRENSPDLVLIDTVLSGIDNVDVLKSFEGQEPSCPVLIWSTYSPRCDETPWPAYSALVIRTPHFSRITGKIREMLSEQTVAV